MRCFDSFEPAEQLFLQTAPDSWAAQFRQKAAAARDFARRCLARNGDLLRHLSTANVARDLDVLRQAVGDKKLTFDGFSYGTYLGATYAALSRATCGLWSSTATSRPTSTARARA